MVYLTGTRFKMLYSSKSILEFLSPLIFLPVILSLSSVVWLSIVTTIYYGAFTLSRTRIEKRTGPGPEQWRTIGLGPCPGSGVMWQLPHSFIQPICSWFLFWSRFRPEWILSVTQCIFYGHQVIFTDEWIVFTDDIAWDEYSVGGECHWYPLKMHCVMILLNGRCFMDTTCVLWIPQWYL